MKTRVAAEADAMAAEYPYLGKSAQQHQNSLHVLLTQRGRELESMNASGGVDLRCKNVRKSSLQVVDVKSRISCHAK